MSHTTAAVLLAAAAAVVGRDVSVTVDDVVGLALLRRCAAAADDDDDDVALKSIAGGSRRPAVRRDRHRRLGVARCRCRRRRAAGEVVRLPVTMLAERAAVARPMTAAARLVRLATAVPTVLNRHASPTCITTVLCIVVSHRSALQHANKHNTSSQKSPISFQR